ncbi:MAG TPA: aldo/keto reductase [Kofleriaceae bacterium]|nr:aldo/keto reductase [Kofleriaceae bacterium]
MRSRSLGVDGPLVTAVGCGDVSLARAAVRGVDAREVEAALCEAIERGVTIVEVADEDDARRMVGGAVRALGARDRVVVACQVHAAHKLAAPVDAALRALRLDAPGVWLLAGATPSADLAGAAGDLRRAGKALCWGVVLDALDEIAGETWLSAVAVPTSICERVAYAGPHAWLARRPLAGGALAGGIGEERPPERIAVGAAKLAPYVKREPPAARSCDAARAQLERNPRIAHIECETLAELALRFVIDRGAIALPRLHRREHVAEAIAAASAPPLSYPEQIFSMLDEP